VEDFLSLGESLSDEERLVQESVKRFVEESVMPVIGEAYEKASFPTEFIDESANLGLLGLTLPEEYGGSSASYTSYGLVCQELERGDSGLRSFVSVQNSLCMFPIYKYGSEEQRQTFLNEMAEGKLIASFGLTEPDSGSDPASMRTFAKKVSGGYLLNGSKMWITNAPIADLAVVWAQTEEGIRGFIVERDFDGFSTPEIHQKMSLRASRTGELVFENVFVPESHFLPGSVKGLSAPLSCLTEARFGIAFGAIGAAMACFDTAHQYCMERKQFDKPIASFQLIQKSLADMFTEITKTQCFNLQLARLKEEGRATHVMVSMAKKNACEVALNVARTCRNLLGGNGISLEYHIIRHMTNLESVFTYEGTDNIHTLAIGRYLTGINAFG
jgi:glutaryl-CoA dehydrogenase